ncbi:MAG: 16S rRNA (cytosine(1402)-N(4))-methyltransferase RsmH [Planctomycetes bacterium]|nr:16S rRNA (cytosine(1402)-N(4))-methyltransferase RsmH [Planctomycetota bacterium]
MVNQAENEQNKQAENGLAIEHIPVLADTLTEQVALPRNGTVVDATIGQGGHSLLFGKQLGSEGTLIGFDVDENALSCSSQRLKDLDCRVLLIHSNFAGIVEALRSHDIGGVDFILADLGYSSVQLSDLKIGISFQEDMPLDMRIDRSLETSAADIVNGLDETSLANLIFEFGQDRASRRIARFIVRQREHEPITTTGQLAAIVCKALYRPGQKKRNRIHPATRTFQALRIAVNYELDNLTQLLTCAPHLLNANGRVAIISFHSLEDRLVKYDFRGRASEGIYKVLTKKPLVPTEKEVQANRRARSAKLRIAQRIRA